MFEKLESVLEKYEALGRKLADPRVLADPATYQRLSKEHGELAPLAEHYLRYKDLLRQISETQEILRDKTAEAELKKLAEQELASLGERRKALEQELKVLMLPKDPNDRKNVILEVRAGTGGEEAALFAADLFRMYLKYAEAKGWRVEVLSSHPTGIGGFKEVIASIEGQGAYSRLKYESGVHRVQRIPVTEASGRIHTSAVTVAVLPEAEEVDVQIDPKDLRVDTYCASGPGGQGVNTTYSAVRITHLPTGLVVTCQDERSQIKNKAKAMKVLRARLLNRIREASERERAQARRSQVGTGDRSERIRTYNFPQNRVTDHRVGLTLHKLAEVLDGDLDPIVDALVTADNAERLRQMEVGV